jgi:hypothetical protein
VPPVILDAFATGFERARSLVEPSSLRVAQAVLAIGLFLLAYSGGVYDPEARAWLGVGVWAVLAFAASAGLLRARWSAASTLLALFALWNMVGLVWTRDVETGLRSATLALLYLGLFLLLVELWTRVRNARLWAGTVAVAMVATISLALVARLLPSVVKVGRPYDILPASVVRLSYPLGYWNALGALIACALPLLLCAGTIAVTRARRTLALLPVPVLAVALYLTSSRGGFAAAAVGVVAFVVVSSGVVRTLLTALVAAGAAVAAIAVVKPNDALVNRPEVAAAVTEGRRVALLLCVIVVLLAVVYLALDRIVEPRRAWLSRWDTRARIVVVVAAVAMVGAAHPTRRFDAFRTVHLQQVGSGNYVQRHLSDPSGNGRWQMWTSAVHQFEAHPVLGGGPGTFAAWWAEHRPFSLFILDAHSLYLQTLAELGLVGLLLLAAFLAVPIAHAARRLGGARLPTSPSAVAAGFLGTLVAASIAIAVDWSWEIPGFSAFVLAVAAPLASSPPPRPDSARPWGRSWAGIAVAPLALVIALVCAQPGLVIRGVNQSQEHARSGDLRAAVGRAAATYRLAPWAWSPPLQAALAAEDAKNYAAALAWAKVASAKGGDRADIWLIRSRIEQELGLERAARASLRRAERLNPLGVTEGIRQDRR